MLDVYEEAMKGMSSGDMSSLPEVFFFFKKKKKFPIKINKINIIASCNK